MKYFNSCHTLNEVKAMYRQLAKLHHPDKGGNTSTMQEINKEYVIAIAFAAKNATNYKGEKFSAQEVETEILKAQAYQDAVNKVINLEGCNLELVGCWLWITGNTKPYAKLLKSDPAKFVWAKKKTDFSAWFFRTDEYKTTTRGQKLTLDEIRNKYGTQEIKGSYNNYITQ